MPRRHTCFACHALFPRQALHFQWIPAGYRGRGSGAKVLMCAVCASAQGEVNKTEFSKVMIFGVILLVMAGSVRLLIVVNK
jgi:hypothetical protein